MARPKKPIDKDRVLALASNMCTWPEIAADQGCSEDTLQRRFAGIYKKGQELAKLSLRAKQFAVAMGRPSKSAVYLRQHQTKEGVQHGDLVLDEKGRPILLHREVEEVKPNVGMLIWLGKQHLGQSDTFKWEEGDGFDFVSPDKK